MIKVFDKRFHIGSMAACLLLAVACSDGDESAGEGSDGSAGEGSDRWVDASIGSIEFSSNNSTTIKCATIVVTADRSKISAEYSVFNKNQ